MAKVIAFANHKGGVGKTASVSAIGSILASAGKKVLLVDLDTQANLTRCHTKDFPSRTVYHALKEKEDLPIIHSSENLDLVPSGLEMAGIELEISGYMQRESLLKKLLSPFLTEYDYILLDCPPSLGLVTINAFVATEYMFVPMLADTMSLYGLEMITDICNVVRELNPSIDINGIFFTKYDKRVSLTSAIEQMVELQYEDKVLKQRIRINTKIGEAPMYHQNIVEYDPQGKSITDYTGLLREILKVIGDDTEI